MKTNIRAWSSRIVGLPTALLLLPLVSPAAEKAAPPKKAEESKTHVLFMGADVSVQRDKKSYRVEGVVGSELLIRIGKNPVYVPTRMRAVDLKVEHDLKLSGASVQLDGLESGPSYTPGNDPRLKFQRESGAAGGAAAVQDLAYGRMISASLSAGFAAAAAAGPGGNRPEVQAAAADAQSRLDTANRELDAAGQMMMQDRFNTGTYADTMAKELAEGNYDAVEASFKISSPVELTDPYMVLVFKVLEREAKPGEESTLIYAKSLEPITSKPRYIRVREGGMPRGFKFLECQVHIYNRGKEVATNVSPKRVELTRDEARQYILIEHIGANKGATVPAMPAPGGLRPGDRERLTLEQLARTSYVKVSEEGTLLAAYADEACAIQLEDPAMVAVLGEVFYRPALVNGKPVAGVARVRLSDQSL
jgi:hypothetical protein